MKKVYFNLSLMLLFSWAISSCKKETAEIGSGTSALTIVNGFVGSADNNYLFTNFNGTNLSVPFYSLLDNIPYGMSKFSTSYNGQQNLSLYQTADTSLNGRPLYQLSLDLSINTIHTLFLSGRPQTPDTLFTTDQFPYHAPADSTMGIRFVNLTQGSAPVSINLIGKANGSEVTNLPYKGITAFKTYPANSKIDNYTFEFRNRVTSQLVGSVELTKINDNGAGDNGANIWRNNNITLVLLSEDTPYAPNRVLIISQPK